MAIIDQKPLSQLIVRPAQPADTRELLRIERVCFSDPWTAQHLEEDDCLVAVIESQIAGFLVWRELCPAKSLDPAEYEILNLAVDPTFRRRGIARTLLGQILQVPGSFFLEVRESNHAAQELYRNLGFTSAGVRKNYYRQPIESAIVMNLKRC